MAKKRSSLFGEDSLLQRFVDGAAIGLGGPDRRALAEKQAKERRDEQQKAVEAGERARKEAIASQLPPERQVDIPDFESQVLGGDASKSPVERVQTEAQGVPPLVSDQDEVISPSDLIPTGPSLFGDIGNLEYGRLPPPVVDPSAEMDAYLEEFSQAPLNPEGQKGLIRLNQIAEQAQSDELLPHQKAELVDQFRKERDRLKLERKVQKPPTVEEEAATRITVGPNGMQTIMQPDGRIDTKDPTTKAELKQLEIQQKDQENRIKIDSLRMQQQEQRRVEREVKRAEKLKADQKIAEEKQARYQEHWTKAITEKPMSDRYDEARKELEATYKALNPKLPMRQFSPSEIRTLAESKIALDFGAKERFANPSNPSEQRKVTPEDRIREMIKTDPDGFRESLRDKMNDIEIDPNYKSMEGDTLEEKAMYALMGETPEALESKLDSLIAKKVAETTLPSDVTTPNTQVNQSPYNLLRPDRDRIKNDLATQFGVDPSQIDKTEVDRELAKREEDGIRQVVSTRVSQMRTESQAIRDVEQLLSDRTGNPIDLGSILDVETIGFLHKQGSKNPIEDAAKHIATAIQTGAENINLYSPMEREAAKMAFPLVLDETDAGFKKVSVGMGQMYRDGMGNIKERQSEPEPKSKSPARVDTSNRQSRTNNIPTLGRVDRSNRQSRTSGQ